MGFIKFLIGCLGILILLGLLAISFVLFGSFYVQLGMAGLLIPLALFIIPIGMIYFGFFKH